MIVFIDESGLSERPTRVSTWAPKGCTPVIQFHFNWKHVSAIAGMTRANFMFRLHDGSIKSAQVVEFLKALRAQIRRKLLIVWDGAAQHKSRIVREYLDSTRGAAQMGAVPHTRPWPTCAAGASSPTAPPPRRSRHRFVRSGASGC